MTGAAGTMALVLAETVAGGLAFLWCTPLWNEVKRGFFTLTARSSWCWRSRPGGRRRPALIDGDAAGEWAVGLAAGVRGGHRPLDAVPASSARSSSLGSSGVAGVVVAIAVLVRDGERRAAVVRARAVPAARRRGVPRLGHRRPVPRPLVPDRPGALARADRPASRRSMLVAVVLEAVAVDLGRVRGDELVAGVNPLLTAGALAPWIALGMVGTTALIAVLTRAALKGDARLSRAVGHGLLLPGGRDRVHRRGRREDPVPAELSRCGPR